MSKIISQASALVQARDLKNDYFSFTLAPFAKAASCRPGQFIHLELPHTELWFRRAMSVASVDPSAKSVEFIFKVFGRGTRLLAGLRKGAEIGILGPLGKPFTRPKKSETVVMIGGGVGFPPLMYFAEDLVRRGYDPQRIHFFYGGRSKTDLVERTRIKGLGIRFHPVTDDGSLGQRGLVTAIAGDWLKAEGGSRPRLYACGPEPMLAAVDAMGQERDIPGELSLEAPMPCGVGICLACVVPLVRGGYARVCADGPVFPIGEVQW